MTIGIDFIGVSAGGVVRNDRGEYFLAKRGVGARDDMGMWEFPGGQVAFSETREAAIVRIMKEKYGMDIAVRGVLGIYDIIDAEAGDHWLSTTYRCDHSGGVPEIRESRKCNDVGWFTKEDIAALTLSRISTLNWETLSKQ